MRKTFYWLIVFGVSCSSLFSHVYLSFIIPCYNRKHTLQETIDSIYQQRLPFQFEIVCVDDGSTDGSYEFLKECERKYPNFSVFKHETNIGASEARNTCVKHAKGELIFSLDSDNILEKDSIKPLVDLMERSGCEAAAFGETRHFKGKRHHVYSDHYLHMNGIFDLECMFKNSKSPGASGNYLYTKKSFYRARGYSGHGCETWVFCFKQLVTGTKFAILPGHYWHRISSDSYWMRLESQGLNDKNCLAVVRAFNKVFVEATVKFLKTYDLKQRRFFYDLNHGLFKIKPAQMLKNVFDEYVREMNP